MDVHVFDAEPKGSMPIKMPPNHSGGRSKLVVALVAQSLLVVICIGLSFHSWYTVNSMEKDDSNYKKNKDMSTYLEWTRDKGFIKIGERNKKSNNTVFIPCGGPYMVYMAVNVCKNKELGVNNTLSLLDGNKVLMTFHIQSSETCTLYSEEGEHKIYTFKTNDTISLSLTDKQPNFKIGYLHLTFYYMLDGYCFN